MQYLVMTEPNPLLAKYRDLRHLYKPLGTPARISGSSVLMQMNLENKGELSRFSKVRLRSASSSWLHLPARSTRPLNPP